MDESNVGPDGLTEEEWVVAWKREVEKTRLRAVKALDAHFAKMAPTIAAINAGMNATRGKP